ncbi:hypothetical protein [Massilia sp. IC2-476]|uniref:hypothetical protein n=1 Tax=Massilia sp. IC2-476 TaxID=2887199 RepID=UPI001D12AEFC|nr:hypothetical protein [Massilia sp. IC2-476]MCC2970308.1 hypothetical protein [Massilia sp. IC2-476]
MRVSAAVLTGAFLVSVMAGAQAAPPADHPILGIWKLSLPDLGCSETYRFRADGTTLVTSAEEVSESEYDIPAKPSTKGFYRLDDRIVKDNGKKDCAGAVMKPGTRATNYIRFHPSKALFLMCADESMQTCIGPFERVQGEEA